MYTIEHINALFENAESPNRANVVEALIGYVSCYVSYAFVRTHYEQVR